MTGALILRILLITKTPGGSVKYVRIILFNSKNMKIFSFPQIVQPTLETAPASKTNTKVAILNYIL